MFMRTFFVTVGALGQAGSVSTKLPVSIFHSLPTKRAKQAILKLAVEKPW